VAAELLVAGDPPEGNPFDPQRLLTENAPASGGEAGGA
jgi:hypothetical protein